MSEFVDISLTSSAPTSSPAQSRNVVIISKASAFSGMIMNVGPDYATTLIAEGILSTDAAYKAVADFYSVPSPGAGVHLYCIPTSPSNISNVEVLGNKNGTNLNFWVPYSPVTSLTGFEFYPMHTYDLNDAVWDSLTGHTGSWYACPDAISNITGTTSNGIYSGGITIGADGLGFSGAHIGAISGMLIEATDRLRCTVVPNGLSMANKALLDPTLAFEFVTFGYNPTLACPTDPLGTSAFMYASGQCIAGRSWLHDVYNGTQTVNNINTNGKRAQFLWQCPEGVGPNSVITGAYLTGMETLGTTLTYSDARSNILPIQKFISPIVTDQSTATGKNAAIVAAASLMAEGIQGYRKPMNFMPISVANITYPDGGTRKQWTDAGFNVVMLNPQISSTVMLHGNATFGSGTDSQFNYIRCMQRVIEHIYAALNTLLFSRTVHYDLSGIQRIEDTIRASIKADVGTYIDDVGTITIPVKAYLQAEPSLDAGGKILLATWRASECVDNMVANVIWNGQVTSLKLTVTQLV